MANITFTRGILEIETNSLECLSDIVLALNKADEWYYGIHVQGNALKKNVKEVKAKGIVYASGEFYGEGRWDFFRNINSFFIWLDCNLPTDIQRRMEKADFTMVWDYFDSDAGNCWLVKEKMRLHHPAGLSFYQTDEYHTQRTYFKDLEYNVENLMLAYDFSRSEAQSFMDFGEEGVKNGKN